MIPLEPVFKMFTDKEDQEISKVDLNDDSMVSNGKAKVDNFLNEFQKKEELQKIQGITHASDITPN